MTVIVDVQNASSNAFPKVDKIQIWAESALHDIEQECELTIRLVDEAESAELNETYRDKSGPTNVLSFPFEAPVVIEPRLLGDLVICVPIVTKEADQQNKQLEDHWAHMVVHGCLHLLGYDHIEDGEANLMEGLEKKILKSLAINDPYREQGDDK